MWWFIGFCFIALIFRQISIELRASSIVSKSFPPMYSSCNGKFGASEPFWVKHETDGQYIKNHIYTDDSIFLNEKGVALKKEMLKKNPDCFNS